jgi:hypothetical protein
MIFAIDLLKGQGLPAKSRPEGIAAVVITISVPVIMATIMVSGFYVNKVNISVKRNEIARLEKELGGGVLGTAVKKQAVLEDEAKDLSAGLSDISFAINGQTQWSGVLEAVVKNMPQSVMLKTADVKRDSKKVKKAKETEAGKDNKGETVEVSVPIRILHLSLTSFQQSNFDQVVRKYRDSLLADPAVGPKLDEIRVSQEFDKVENKEIISYEMYLVFSPSL